jgi:hypothetical protein
MSNDEKDWDMLPERTKSEVLQALTIGLRSAAQGLRVLSNATLRAAEALQKMIDSAAEEDVEPTDPPVAPTGPTGATGPTGPTLPRGPLDPPVNP